jgi:hypothetical protein
VGSVSGTSIADIVGCPELLLTPHHNQLFESTAQQWLNVGYNTDTLKTLPKSAAFPAVLGYSATVGLEAIA